MDKVLKPVTQVLKKNSVYINAVMLVLVFAFLFPFKDFLPIAQETEKKIENQLRDIMKTPWVMAIISILLLVIFYTNDTKMLALSLYVVHYLALH